MIRSMTAFTRQTHEAQWGELSWELRSVNHRYLEATLRMPEELRALEMVARARISTRLKRGKVDGFLRFQPLEAATGLQLNRELIAAVLQANEVVESLMENPARTRPLEVLRWPGVLQAAETDLSELKKETLTLLDRALDDLIETREREGAGMKGIIEQRCDAMAAEVVKVRAVMPDILTAQREKIISRVAELQVELEPERLAQEIAMITQKSDVAEELDRIEVHLEEVRRVLGQNEPVGRRLDFLMQELNRESNTLGSKSISTESTSVAVEMKVLIEQMREQVQNIE
ncbi:MAG: YicC family protein [Thiotrichales bacterium]|nr:MAG: YicC family protein [Thiotrichales bacterium]PCI11412.1 MAG: YicC family protein [Thiotrichales bacterium]